ncbi:MAG: hypothetical protein ACI86H_002866 [bacterium]|jgi:hypothetical protein
MRKMMNTLAENVNEASFDFSSLRMSQKTYDCIHNGYKIKETFPNTSKTKLKNIKKNALVLYEFFLIRVKKQQNFILWANEKFSCQGTDLSPKAYQKAKKYLKSLNLVAKFKQNRTLDGKFSERAYIRVNYLRDDIEEDIFSYLDSLSHNDLNLVFLGLEPSSHFTAKSKKDSGKKIHKKTEIPSDFPVERRVYQKQKQAKTCNPPQTGKAKFKYQTEKKAKVESTTNKRVETERKKDNRWWKQSAKEQKETFDHLPEELQKNVLKLADYSRTVLDYHFSHNDYYFFLQLDHRLRKFTFREMILVILGESCRSKKSRDLPKVLNNPQWMQERIDYSNDPEKSKWIENRVKRFPPPIFEKKAPIPKVEKPQKPQFKERQGLNLEPFCTHGIGCGVKEQLEVPKVKNTEVIFERNQKAKSRFGGIIKKLSKL